nr:MAG TPA: hypothetical protein [Caudoviricetes sp.]
MPGFSISFLGYPFRGFLWGLMCSGCSNSFV